MKITRALVSVFDKNGLDKLASIFKNCNIEVLSTGGTAKLLKSYGVNVIDVSDYTGFPEMMDGRVKTLHPKIHGGLLAVRSDASHVEAAKKNNIEFIDLVIVNLYPFEETVRKGASFEEIIENIDIGGPSMIRSAAKNHEFTTIITSPNDYDKFIDEMYKNDGAVSDEFRKKMAAKAFHTTAKYDTAISKWFSGQDDELFPEVLNLTATLSQNLRYGENPHQKAAFYSIQGEKCGIATAVQLQGKELSYNNINDANAALQLVAEFDEPAVAIIKHANPCGAAIGKDAFSAYKRALACDPVSAFGGIIALNRKVDKQLAEIISEIFVEAVIAEDFDPEAREIFAKKKNVRLLCAKAIIDRSLSIKSVQGGLLIQENDLGVTDDLKIVTKRTPTDNEIKEMIFAFKICKHVKSNAIVLAKDNTTIGIGAGQMSRVDSSRIAVLKAGDIDKNLIRGSVMASDAFFPFADGVIEAAKAGVTAIIQPGGSIRDEEVIKAANDYNIAMVFTGKRHFKH